MAVEPRGHKSQKKKKETDIFHTIVFIVFVILTINLNF